MNYAFLVHARDYSDVQRKYKIAKYLPRILVEFWCLHWPPVVVSNITNLKLHGAQKEITGWIIGIPMTGEQILEHKDLAKKKILKAIEKAKKLGAGIVGLGALTSPVTNGGVDLVDTCGINLTNGNNLTACVSFEHVKNIIGKNPHIKNIAVVGATGSVGQTTLLLLTGKFPEMKYLLFARTEENLKILVDRAKKEISSLDIESYLNDLGNLKDADLVIVVTSASSAIIKDVDLRHGAIVYDVTQPPNVDKKILKKRPDLKIYDGGWVYIDELKKKLPFGLPPKIVFACFAETVLLAADDCSVVPKDCQKKDNRLCIVGKSNPKTASDIWKLFKKYNFQIR